MAKGKNRYVQLIEAIFQRHYQEGNAEVSFERTDIELVAGELGIKLPKNIIDIFTGITCYSLQNHLRTTVPDVGQVETDEVYVGIDRRGVHLIDEDLVALFALEQTEEGLRISIEKHYRLVQPEDLSAEELESYRWHSQ